jgi:hypothetical protein
MPGTKPGTKKGPSFIDRYIRQAYFRHPSQSPSRGKPESHE